MIKSKIKVALALFIMGVSMNASEVVKTSAVYDRYVSYAEMPRYSKYINEENCDYTLGRFFELCYNFDKKSISYARVPAWDNAKVGGLNFTLDAHQDYRIPEKYRKKEKDMKRFSLKGKDYIFGSVVPYGHLGRGDEEELVEARLFSTFIPLLASTGYQIKRFKNRMVNTALHSFYHPYLVKMIYSKKSKKSPTGVAIPDGIVYWHTDPSDYSRPGRCYYFDNTNGISQTRNVELLRVECKKYGL